MKNVDAFGYGFTSWTQKTEAWNTAPFGNSTLLPGQPAGSLAVPMNSKAAINAVPNPPPSAYPPPANEGSVSDAWVTLIYWQHSIDVIPAIRN